MVCRTNQRERYFVSVVGLWGTVDVSERACVDNVLSGCPCADHFELEQTLDGSLLTLPLPSHVPHGQNRSCFAGGLPPDQHFWKGKTTRAIQVYAIVGVARPRFGHGTQH